MSPFFFYKFFFLPGRVRAQFQRLQALAKQKEGGERK
jgi:hypothetical protein